MSQQTADSYVCAEHQGHSKTVVVRPAWGRQVRAVTEQCAAEHLAESCVANIKAGPRPQDSEQTHMA